MVPLFSDVLPQSGATQIATDSVGVVARFLSQFTEGVHADGVQGNGYLIPKLIQQCTQFEELTGDAGDVAILHPCLLQERSTSIFLSVCLSVCLRVSILSVKVLTS